MDRSTATRSVAPHRGKPGRKDPADAGDPNSRWVLLVLYLFLAIGLACVAGVIYMILPG